MINPLILLHAMVAEFGLFAFLWVLVEVLNPTEARIRRARIAAGLGLACLLVAWFAGGFYYVEVYGSHVKPAIKASEVAWVHSVVMEVKEHVFLFLPVLAATTAALLIKYNNELLHNRDARVSVAMLAGLVFLLGFAIAGMGVIIAGGYRFAMEAGLA